MGMGGGGGGSGGGFGAFSTIGEEQKKRTTPDLKLISRLFEYSREYHRNLILGVSTIVITSVTALCIPYLHKVAIDQIITPLNISATIWWIPLFVSVILVHYLAQYTQVYQMRIVGENVVAKMREEMMHKLQEISLRYFSEGEIGRIISRPINDANVVRIFLRMGLTTIILSVSSLIGSLMIIFFLNVKLSLMAISILPVAAVVAWFMGGFSRRANRRVLINTSGLTSRMQENFSGIKVIKALVREDKAAEQFRDSADRVAKAGIRAVEISSSYQPVVFLMRVVGTALILWFGATMTGAGEITIGTLVAFTEYQFQYFRPLTELISAYDQYQAAMAATERMFDLIDTNVEVEDISPDKAKKIETINNVEFKNVVFGYDKKIPVIKNISFTISSNKKLAIVGPTGAGKSTIINLLSRFYDPLDGKIFVNGTNIKDIPISSLREHMSIVLQDSFLFPMSVKDNIRFGKPEASDEEVIEAAKAVGAHEFIMKLPNGYEYVLQEGSSNISIGQRQLISFARTLLMNPKLLILDEATSSIDPYTELVIQTALKKLLENRLAIIIAHRLSTIRLCDEIIVIDHGEIAEKGTHSELMNSGGLYSSFYRMQFREESGLEVDVKSSS
jgi:ATP-binding cassette subfamily B protein